MESFFYHSPLAVAIITVSLSVFFIACAHIRFKMNDEAPEGDQPKEYRNNLVYSDFNAYQDAPRLCTHDAYDAMIAREMQTDQRKPQCDTCNDTVGVRWAHTCPACHKVPGNEAVKLAFHNIRTGQAA